MKKFTKKWEILFSLLIAFYSNVNAQFASSIPHTFSVATTPPAFGGATTFVVAAANIDDWDTLIAPLGFSFNFGGVVYTKVVISTNGWVALCPSSTSTVPPTLIGGLPNNALNNNTTGYPIIAPLWDDLSTSVITHGMSSGAYWVRWTSKWQKGSGVAASSLFYLKLDGSNNSITFYYSNNATYIPTTPTASIGIAGICTGDFYSVSVTSNTTAYIDSVVEDTLIGQGTPNNYRPYNCYYTFTPLTSHSNDSCAAARAMGTVTSVCTPVLATTYNAGTSGSPGNCSTADVKDVWFSYIKPSGVSNVLFTTSPAGCGSVTGTSMEVYDACGGTLLGCGTTSVANPQFADLIVTRNPCVVETLFVRVTSDGDIPGKFLICSQDVSTTTGATCATATPVCFPLPYNTSGTTQGSGNDYNDSVLCRSQWMTGQDYLYIFTPPTTGCFNFLVDGAGLNTYPGLYIFDGCPGDTAFTTCVASDQRISSGDSIMNISLTGGHAYYILIDNNAVLAGTNFINYNFHITHSSAAAPANDICASPAPLGIIPFNQACIWSQPYYLACATPSPLAGYPNPSCGGFVPSMTNDVWFTFQPNFSDSIKINTQGGSYNPAQHLGMAVYSGTCGSFNLVACDGDSTCTQYLPGLNITVTNQLYYLRVWSSFYGDPGSVQICFESPTQVGLSEVENSFDQIKTYPNPVSDDLNIEFKQYTQQVVDFAIIDPQLRVIYTQKVVCSPGINKYHKNIADIAAGVYYISIINPENQSRFNAKFIKN